MQQKLQTEGCSNRAELLWNFSGRGTSVGVPPSKGTGIAASLRSGEHCIVVVLSMNSGLRCHLWQVESSNYYWPWWAHLRRNTVELVDWESLGWYFTQKCRVTLQTSMVSSWNKYWLSNWFLNMRNLIIEAVSGLLWNVNGAVRHQLEDSWESLKALLLLLTPCKIHPWKRR